MANTNQLHCSPVQQWPGKPKEFIVVNDGDTMNYALANGVLTVDDNANKEFLIPWHLIDRIKQAQVLCPQAAQAQVDTITTSVLPQNYPTDQPTVIYSITLEYKDIDTLELVSKTYSVSFNTATTWTEATVTAAFIAEIEGDDDAIVTPTDSSNHLRLTAVNEGQWFRTTVKASIMSVSNTTPNLIAFGTGSGLIKYGGWTTDDGIADDDDVSYVIVEIPYYTIDTGDLPSFNNESGSAVLKFHRLWLVIQEGGDAESSTLGTAIGNGLCAILSGVATAAKYSQVIEAGCPCS